jgi:adenylate cyclase
LDPTDAKRRLSAILMADVVGYSRLMGEDEQATLRTLTAHREIFSRHIKQHDGRVVNAPGDSVLAEFGSVVDAVRCAAEIQRELAEKNAELPTERAMNFRIGINLGDVLVKDDALYGDGVNIAARLESLAEPGGICISGKVHAEVETKLPFQYEFMGEHTVKNIAKPVAAYKVLSHSGAAARRATHAFSLGTRRNKLIGFAGAAVVIAAAVIAASIYLLRPIDEPGEIVGTDSVLPFSGKPAIAVLPFDNMSQDQDQEWFADGLTESLITDLAKLENVLVIARNSVFRYKGKAVDVQQVSRELNVDYVVEGSVQSREGRVRINAQIVDGRTGTHLWSERYDRTVDEYFTVQDEIIQQIVASLDIEVLRGEKARLHKQATNSLAAYEFLRKWKEAWYNVAIQDCAVQEEGFALLNKALELDPNYSSAYVDLAWNHYHQASYGCVPPEEATAKFQEAVVVAQRAIELNPSDPEAYGILAVAYNALRQFDKFIEAGEQGVALSPNNTQHLVVYAWGLTHVRRYERSRVLIEKSIRLQPFHESYVHNIRAMAYFWLGDFDVALNAIEAAYSRTPHHSYTLVYKTVILSAMGREDNAREAGVDLVARLPDFTVDNWLANSDVFENPEDAARIRELLEAAGVR